MPLHIVGAGFGRTGTNSLKLALEALGFAPCHHMLEVHERPEQVDFWSAAARDETRDWDTVFRDFKASVDWPSAFFWRELAEHYPKAKVILTVRPEQEWVKSIQSTIHESLTNRGKRATELQRRQGEMAFRLVEERTFHGKLGDPEYALAIYRAHILDVKRSIAPDRLLVLDVAQGWEPLCRHLGLPVPATPFPKTNSTEEFRARMQKRMAGQS